ncbi:ABC transporter permease [Parapedobacter soli]|uniref:ABC transporter permease n=1 Tax=Parapedobacter soli TaxID=416955 RepID=UPI0029056B20|nr:FtsX-like permease family protein [Parapedobacter soli]
MYFVFLIRYLTFAKVQIISGDLNFPYFLAKRIAVDGKRTFSGLIVRVAVGAIALGIAAMMLSIAVLKGFKGEVTAKQRGFFGDITLISYDLNSSYEPVPISLSAEDIREVRTVPGVTDIRHFATKAGIITINDEVEGVLFKGIDSSYNQQFLESALVDGLPIDFADSAKAATQILLSQYTANRLQLSVGDDFIMYFVQLEGRPRPRKFRIAGIFHTGVEELDNSYVIGALSLVRRLNDWEAGAVGGYEVTIDDFSKLDGLTEAVRERLPLTIDAISVRDQLPEIFQWLDLLDVNTIIILILMIVVAVVNMVSALLIIILERTSMIGILKALGYGDGGIRNVFLYQAAYLIGLGLALGNLLGYGLYWFQRQTHYFKLDEASYYVSYVPVDISLLEVVLLNAGIAVVALAVLIIPSYLIARISPIKAIQFQ